MLMIQQSVRQVRVNAVIALLNMELTQFSSFDNIGSNMTPSNDDLIKAFSNPTFPTNATMLLEIFQDKNPRRDVAFAMVGDFFIIGVRERSEKSYVLDQNVFVYHRQNIGSAVANALSWLINGTPIPVSYSRAS